MGPPPFGDGKAPGPDAEESRADGFNGATAFRRWKEVAPTKALSVRESFNGATAFRRWKGSRRSS